MEIPNSITIILLYYDFISAPALTVITIFNICSNVMLARRVLRCREFKMAPDLPNPDEWRKRLFDVCEIIALVQEQYDSSIRLVRVD